MIGEGVIGDAGFARPAAGVRVLLEHAASRGMGASTALSGTGLRVADLDRGDLPVTAAQELRVVRTVRRALGEVGAEVGARYRLATFGPLGYAIGSGRTLGEAMDVAARFLDLSHTLAWPRADVVDARVVVTVDGRALPADVRRFCVERDVTAVHAVLDSLVPGGVGARLEPEPAGERTVARLGFAAAELDRPLPRTGAHSLARAEQLCATLVAAGRAWTGTAHDVRVHVLQALPDGAPMTTVAAGLGLSERTLRRRLEAEGTTYQEVLDEVRRSLSAALLTGRTTMPVAEVAARLGYAGPSPFIVAHRRWTGRTPRTTTLRWS